jgi:hypothetical protein
MEPRDGEGHDLWLHGRQHYDEGRFIRRHYVAEHAETGQLLGYGSVEQPVYLPKYRLFMVFDPVRLRDGVGDLLLERLTSDLTEVNAITVSVREHASRAVEPVALQEHTVRRVQRPVGHSDSYYRLRP